MTPRFRFIRPSSLAVGGWMKKQLEIQSSGLVGNLDKVWPDVAESKWIGGEKEGWERFPYFLDGYIPMAFLLHDEEKIAKCRKYANALLESQHEDGAYYPKGTELGDVWSVFLVAKVLTVYADCSSDKDEEKRILESLYTFLRGFNASIGSNPPARWGQARWFECIIPIMWVYERRPEKWLITLARRLKIFGLDYSESVKLWADPDLVKSWTLDTHVVNIAMALKSEALYCAATCDEMTGLAEKMLNVLDEFYGNAYSHFNGDECLHDNSPMSGSELCGIVEAMYSYEWLTAVTGDSKWGDRLEALAFNALPATVSEDMWAHQYDQQPNQVAVKELVRPPFLTNSGEANIFGLEPNFGCCTANMAQGFPKFALSAFMEDSATGRLAIVSPIESDISTGSSTVSVRGGYPFRNSFTLSAGTDTPVMLRIPSWAEPVIGTKAEIKDGWAYFTVGEEVSVEYKAAPKFVPRTLGRYSVMYGSLLFSMPIKYRAVMKEYVRDNVERRFPYCDYEYLPESSYAYAFASDRLEVEECDYDKPFDRTNPPVKIKTELAPVKWETDSYHTETPANICADIRTGPNEDCELYPYGATYLRMTEIAKI